MAVTSVVRSFMQRLLNAEQRYWRLQGYRNVSTVTGNDHQIKATTPIPPNITGKSTPGNQEQCTQHQFAESYVRMMFALGTQDLASTHPHEVKELNALYTHAVLNQEGETRIKLTSDWIFPHEVLAQNTLSGSDISSVQHLSAEEAQRKYVDLTRQIIGY